MRRKTGLAGIVFIFGLYAALAFGIHNGLTRYVIGANDFYSRWAGARALFLEGKDPYSLQVTQEIQLGMIGRLSDQNEDQLAFAYPLYDAIFLLPLVALPYAQAQALWMAGLAMAVVGGVLVTLHTHRHENSPGLIVAFAVGTLFFYPVTRGLFLGQFALLSFLFLALACWCILNRRDAAAGAFLALATVKPQMAALLVPCILGWACWHRRWRIVVGSVLSLGLLALIAGLWLPGWPLDFMRAMVAYAGYVPVGPPVETVLSYLMPAQFAGAGAIFLGLGLVAIAVLEWVRSSDDIREAFSLTAFVTVCTAIRIGSSDQVLLLLPWSLWLLCIWQNGHRVIAWLLGAGIIVIPWLVFLSTLRGDAEDPRVTLVLPFLTLAALISLRMTGFGLKPQRGEAP